MPSLIGLSTLLFVAMPLCAQTVVVQGPPVTSAAAVLNREATVLSGLGCPATLTASRLPGGGVLETRPAADGHRGAPERIGLRVSVGPALLRDSKTAVQARLTLHGIAGTTYLPVGAGRGSATESFTLTPSAPTHKATWQNTIYTQRLTGLQWIELDELTYADGSTWQKPGEGACTFAPNGFMLVGANR